MINKDNIDQLISTFLSGEATPEEAMLLEDWKQESELNLNYYNSCCKIFEATDNHSTDATLTTVAAWEKLKPRLTVASHIKKIDNSFLRYSRVAASLVIVLGLGSLIAFLLKDKSPERFSYAANNVSTTIKLQDGTDVTIAPHATLSTDKEFGKTNRLLRLNGSAYFSVTHQEALPFVIDAGNVFIKDIGTKFNVVSSSNNDTLSVRVDEGIVQLFDSLNHELLLKANESAFYVKSTRQLQRHSTAASIKFNFSNNKLIDVVARLSKAYSVPIELENKVLENCTITTQFTNESIETVLAVITETMGLSYKKTQTGFVITGEKCNN